MHCYKCHVLHEEREYVVSVEPAPDVLCVTEGEQGPPGASAFESWKARNPGGTWDEFMSELGSGAIWHGSEW